jgi:DNA-binding SARP family transcriptional activator
LSDLRLFLLGAPRIERDGSPVDLDTRKAIALVAYLAIEGQTFRRDSLAGLLWPEHGGDQARGALRRTLSTLKKGMGGEGVEADRATVGLTSDAVWTDATEFRRLIEQSQVPFAEGDPDACLALLERAIQLYRGDFMAGFSLRDSVDFEDWQYFQSESHRRLMTSALERAVECLTMRGRFAEAIDRARRWLSLDSLHEPAHRKLMALFAWNDQRASALKQYRECVGLLDRELGVPPLEETTELYRQITDNRLPEPELLALPQDLGSVEVADVHVPTPTPLVGRTTELALLLNAYESVGAAGRVALIEGEAGIGKSRLADEFLTRMHERGSMTATVRCHPEETQLAFGVVTGLLRQTLEEKGTEWLEVVPVHWLSECARLLPELMSLGIDVSPPTRLDDPGAQARFFEGIASFLTAASDGPQRGVLLVDDLHWTDESSLDALLYLAGRLRGRPLLLLGTFRSDEVGTSARVRRLATAAGQYSIDNIELRRLTRDEVSELVTAARPGDASLSDRLYEETEGLPFFLVEYLAALDEGADPESPQWSPPSGVRELLSSRVEQMNETARQVLTTAAVIGRSFDFDTVREAGGRSDDETVTSLDDLTAAGLIKEVAPAGNGSPTFDFSHEGIRRLVYDDASSARRRLLHGRVADSLARSRRRAGVEPGAIAHHYEHAGDDAAAASYYELSGRKASSLFAHAEAMAHFRSALALGHPEPARIHEALADIQTFSGDYSGALIEYETAAALSDQHDLVTIEHKIGTVHHRRGDLDSARSHFEVALELLDDNDHARRSRVCSDLSLTAHRSGDSAAAELLANEALGLAEKTEDTNALAQAHNILGILAKSRGDVDSALEHLQQSADLAGDLSDPTARIAALNNLALARGEAGEPDAAIEILNEALKLCTEQQDRHREAALHNNLADLFHRNGDRERSMEHLKQAVAIFAEIGSKESTMQPEIWKLVEW